MKQALLTIAGAQAATIGWNTDTLNILVNAGVSIAVVWISNMYRKNK